MNLRSFLMRHPRPANLRITTIDGASRTVTVDPKIPWVQLANYVAELEPESIECLDGAGTVLRGTAFDDLDESEGDDLELAPPTPSLAASLVSRVKPPTDPQSQQLVLFAQLLADAYRHTTDVAFDKMISLFEQVNKRYEHTEKALDRMQKIVERLTEARLEQATAEPDLTFSDLASAWQGGAQQSSEQRPPQPAPRREPPPPGFYNGKGHS